MIKLNGIYRKKRRFNNCFEDIWRFAIRPNCLSHSDVNSVFTVACLTYTRREDESARVTFWVFGLSENQCNSISQIDSISHTLSQTRPVFFSQWSRLFSADNRKYFSFRFFPSHKLISLSQQDFTDCGQPAGPEW